MKNRQLIVLGTSLTLLLCGCGAKEEQQPTAGTADSQETEEPTENEPAEELQVSFGSIDGQTYVNEGCGIKVTFPDTWQILEGQDFIDATGQTEKADPETMEDNDSSFDLFAINITTGQTFNIVVMKLPYDMSGMQDRYIKELTQAAGSEIKEELGMQGITNVSYNNDTTQFLGKTVPTLAIYGEYEGTEIYEEQVYVLEGITGLCLTAVSIGEENNDAIFALFEKD